ncbi:O-antigen ligase family protein [Bacillus alveayuensis]|jgi:hypothetical protein|uniref:O-antigen ligase family protein n=1 Tax=Aeribacillus alveayuensis TaxID=279215 RepID=UPI0005CDC0ED|nr:O-antigen ligase family protein [Bacillus alveayuensis]
MTQIAYFRERVFVLLAIFLLFFKPAPGVLLGSNSIIGFTLMTLLAAFLILIYLNKAYVFSNPLHLLRTNWKNDIIFIYLLLTCVSFTVSTITGIIVVPEKTKLFDFLEIYRYIFYITFYLLAKNIQNPALKAYVKPVIIMVLTVEVIGIMQFYNLLNINESLGLIYTMSERHYKMIVYQHRVPSTFLNPNMYGSFLIIVAALFLSFISFINTKKRYTKISIYFLLLLTFFSVLLTTSRTAVITVGGMIVYWLLLNLLFLPNKKRTLIQGLAILFAYGTISYMMVQEINYLNYAAKQIYSTYNAEKQKEGNNDGLGSEKDFNDTSSSLESAKQSLESVSSFKNRYDYWRVNYEEFLKSPIVGHGPMRSNFVSFADNSYLYILARYGIIGLLLFIGFYLFTYFKSFFTLKRESHHPSKAAIAMTINLVLVGYLVMGMVAEVWFNLQSMAFLFVLIGLLMNKKLAN